MEGRVPHVGYSKFPIVQINLPNLFFTAITYALSQWYETYMGQSFSQVISFVSTSKKYCARNFLKTFFIYTNRYFLHFFISTYQNGYISLNLSLSYQYFYSNYIIFSANWLRTDRWDVPWLSAMASVIHQGKTNVHNLLKISTSQTREVLTRDPL